jgi:hypothetical protein
MGYVFGGGGDVEPLEMGVSCARHAGYLKYRKRRMKEDKCRLIQ